MRESFVSLLSSYSFPFEEPTSCSAAESASSSTPVPPAPSAPPPEATPGRRASGHRHRDVASKPQPESASVAAGVASSLPPRPPVPPPLSVLSPATARRPTPHNANTSAPSEAQLRTTKSAPNLKSPAHAATKADDGREADQLDFDSDGEDDDDDDGRPMVRSGTHVLLKPPTHPTPLRSEGAHDGAKKAQAASGGTSVKLPLIGGKLNRKPAAAPPSLHTDEFGDDMDFFVDDVKHESPPMLSSFDVRGSNDPMDGAGALTKSISDVLAAGDLLAAARPPKAIQHMSPGDAGTSQTTALLARSGSSTTTASSPSRQTSSLPLSPSLLPKLPSLPQTTSGSPRQFPQAPTGNRGPLAQGGTSRSSRGESNSRASSNTSPACRTSTACSSTASPVMKASIAHVRLRQESDDDDDGDDGHFAL